MSSSSLLTAIHSVLNLVFHLFGSGGATDRATGREHVSPEGTVCCSHGCKPVDLEFETSAKPRRGDMI